MKARTGDPSGYDAKAVADKNVTMITLRKARRLQSQKESPAEHVEYVCPGLGVETKS